MGFSSTCGKFSLKYLSFITETWAPVSSRTEGNLLFNKTLISHFPPINLVTLCFCFVDRLTVYDALLNTPFCLCVVNVKMALHTCLLSFQDCIWQFLPQKYTDLHELQQYFLSLNILL